MSGVEKTMAEVGRIDWSHFSLADFLELRWRLLHDWQAVLPGGEYFGQARIGDVCYDIQIEWLADDELAVTMSPFFPHDEASDEPPYDELVPSTAQASSAAAKVFCS